MEGLWEVDVPKAKRDLVPCTFCDEVIWHGDLRLKWVPFEQDGGKRACYHPNCAVSAAQAGSCAKVARATLRRVTGLTSLLQDQLSALLDGSSATSSAQCVLTCAPQGILEPCTPPDKPAVPSTGASKNKKAAEPGTEKKAKKAKVKATHESAPPLMLPSVAADDGQKEDASMQAEKNEVDETKKKKVKKVKKTALENQDKKEESGLSEKNAEESETVETQADKASKADVMESNMASADGSSAAIKPLIAKQESGTEEAQGKNKQMQKMRMTDVASEPLELLGPVVGVMDTPRKPLMEAAVATGVRHLDSCAFMAAENGAKLSGADEHGLDKDEAGALTLYTMESELYPKMNSCLRDRDRPKLKPFFPFLRLMLQARSKLPKFIGTVWRGIKKDLRKDYPKGREFYWWQFSSTTKEVSALMNPMFLGKTGKRTLFNIQVRSGVDIVRYSVFQGSQSEAEVLLFPGTKLKVVDGMDMGHGLYQVHLEEVPVPVNLIK